MSSSQFRGVIRDARRQKYVCRLVVEGKRHEGTYFAREEDAARQFDLLAYKRDGAAAVLNFGLTAEQRAYVEGVSLEQLLASFRAQGGRFARGTSAFRGVDWEKKAGKWRAAIQVAGKKQFLGYFEDEQQAALAYDAAAYKFLGAKAQLNFPQGPPPGLEAGTGGGVATSGDVGGSRDGDGGIGGGESVAAMTVAQPPSPLHAAAASGSQASPRPSTLRSLPSPPQTATQTHADTTYGAQQLLARGAHSDCGAAAAATTAAVTPEDDGGGDATQCSPAWTAAATAPSPKRRRCYFATSGWAAQPPTALPLAPPDAGAAAAGCGATASAAAAPTPGAGVGTERGGLRRVWEAPPPEFLHFLAEGDMAAEGDVVPAVTEWLCAACVDAAAAAGDGDLVPLLAPASAAAAAAAAADSGRAAHAAPSLPRDAYDGYMATINSALAVLHSAAGVAARLGGAPPSSPPPGHRAHAGGGIAGGATRVFPGLAALQLAAPPPWRANHKA